MRKAGRTEADFQDYFRQDAVKLRAVFEKEAKYRLVEEYGAGCYTEDEQGRLIFEWDFVNYDNMKQWILSFGSQAMVMEPKCLADDLVLELKKNLNRYTGT